MDAQEMEAFAGVKITPDKSVKGEDPITTSLPKTPGRPDETIYSCLESGFRKGTMPCNERFCALG